MYRHPHSEVGDRETERPRDQKVRVKMKGSKSGNGSESDSESDPSVSRLLSLDHSIDHYLQYIYRGDVCGKDNKFLKLSQGKHRLFQEGEGDTWQRVCPTLQEYLSVRTKV